MSYAKVKALMNKVLGVGYRHDSTTVAADALAIPVTSEYVVKNIGADAEALTLADGLFEGQPLTVYVGDGAGGLGTLTPTTATGWTAAYLRNDGDRLRLRWVNGTVGWVIEEYSRAYGTTSIAVVAADALVIPITHEIVSKTTGGDAEACTLAAGTYDGQRLRIHLTTDGGGDATITPAASLHWATVVLADAKDTVDLRWNGIVGVWEIVGAYGTAAPPVIS